MHHEQEQDTRSQGFHYDLEREYVYPVVHTTYVCTTTGGCCWVFKGSQLHLPGNGCCESPGYRILLINSNGLCQRPNPRLQFSTDYWDKFISSYGKGRVVTVPWKLMAQDVGISSIATDRHIGVAALMKTDYPHIFSINMMCGTRPRVQQKIWQEGQDKALQSTPPMDPVRF